MVNFSGFRTLHSYEDEGYFMRDRVNLVVRRGVVVVRQGVKFLYGANLE